MALPDQARAVVIGGGVAGGSIAYRLAELGWTDIVLVERNTVSSGTTWHAAGDVVIIRGSLELTQMMRDSVSLYTSASAETGQDIGLKHCGAMSLAQTEHRLTDYRRQAALFGSIGGEADVVPPEQVAQLNPFVRNDDILGALHVPEAYRVNPADVAQAVSKAARNRGVGVFENTRVTGIETQRAGHTRRVAAVQTDQGRIACETAVLAGGAWSRDIGRLAGVSVPLHAVEHSYLITNAIDGVDDRLPISRDPDAYIYSREEVGGFLIGFFEPDAKPLPKAQLPDDFSFASLPEDWDHLEPHVTNAINRYPVLETAGIKLLFTGPESFTPDGAFLMGPAPDVTGLYALTGMNSSGIGQSGGAAKALAEWIVGGEPTIDITAFDMRRFPRVFGNTAWLAERARELPSWLFDPNLPRREHKYARNLRLSAFHSRFEAAGARFGQAAGWERPNWFAPNGRDVDDPPTYKRPGWFDAVAEEHRAAREAVALFERTPMAKILVEGPDAEQLLQTACANDLSGPDGRLIYTAMLNSNGGFESDLTVTRLAGDRFLVITGANEGVRDYDHITRLAGDRKVSITDVTSAYAGLALTGPNARELLSRITENDLSDEAFPYLSAQEVWIGPGHAWALRVSYAGELGWELFVPTESAAAVYDAMVAEGEDLGLAHAGAYASNTLRMEKGFRAWGHDITPVETPLEAGLGFAVRFDKQVPFIGRDALLRQRDDGVRKRLVVFTMDETEHWPIVREPVRREGKVVGHLTSSGYGYSIGKMVSMGFVRNGGEPVEADFVHTGAWDIEIAGERVPAQASLTAPYDPRSLRMRG
ncbi:MAG: FAD-dependent oxidoreductase [Alphaproteobacteria bacterium]|nr:FAD-dependent oxidoreductase [Alphaproteobacteria bacterium]